MITNQYSDVSKAIFKFNNDPNVQKLQELYSKKSMIEILGMSRKELPHSDFLAWLLDPKESHNLGDVPLRKFIEILLSDKTIKGSSIATHSLSNKFVASSIPTLIDATIKREYPLNARKYKEYKGRIDILISIKLNETLTQIIIENKTGSKIHNEQVSRYHNCFIKTKKEKEEFIFVYLTPKSYSELGEGIIEGKKSEQACIKEHYIQMNYQSIVDFILEPLLENPIDLYTKHIITDYLNSLNQTSVGGFDTDKMNEKEVKKRFGKGDLIMALRKEERTLIKSFWKEHFFLMSTLEEFGNIDTDVSSALFKEFQAKNDRLLMTVICASLTDNSICNTEAINIAASLLKRYGSAQRTMNALHNQINFTLESGDNYEFKTGASIFFIKNPSDKLKSKYPEGIIATLESGNKIKWNNEVGYPTAIAKLIFKEFYPDQSDTINGCAYFGIEPDGRSLYDLAKSL